MGARNAQSITESLVFASSEIVPAPDREPWDHGWSRRGYRHSARAALHGSEGPVALTEAGLTALESAVQRLLRERQIRDHWAAEDFWGILASLVAAASQAPDRSAFVDRHIERLRIVDPALTISLVANVTWNAPSLVFGDAVIGDASGEFLEFVNVTAGDRCKVGDEEGISWLNDQVELRIAAPGGVRPVAMACWTLGQESLATKETERQLRNLVDLTVLLERDLAAHGVYHRGDINRPGIRGLTLDRGAIERGVEEYAQIELAAFPLTVSELDIKQRAEWFGAEPLPLGELLGQEHLRVAVQSCLHEDLISNSVKLAARWFAEAHYTLAEDDSTLALGVAMDALLGGQRALSGSVMADRFALLSDNPAQRRGLVVKYLDLYWRA